MKNKHILTVGLFSLVLVACGGDGHEQATSNAAPGGDHSGPVMRGFIEFDGERHDVRWSTCAVRPESFYLRWLAEGDDVNFRFQRYEPSAGDDEYRYSIDFTRIGLDSWEYIASSRHQPTIRITEEAVEGEGVVYPRNTPFRERDDALVPIRFEFSCRR